MKNSKEISITDLILIGTSLSKGTQFNPAVRGRLETKIKKELDYI